MGQVRHGSATTTHAIRAAIQRLQASLTSLSQDLAGAGQDLTLGFSHNPAGQIVTRSASNAAYAYAPGAGTTTYGVNGLNQATSLNGSALGYDARGNLTSGPGRSFAYDSLNQLTQANGADLYYDPAGRLNRFIGGTDIRFLRDGDRVIAEYDPSGAIARRHVPGPGVDETVAGYSGGTATRHWLLADERGSVIALANGSGTATTINRYDEYGVPAPGNAGLFQYTDQIWLQDRGLYHYKARAYDPALGRFLQPDPIGYGEGANLYAYVSADPMNFTDPTGMARFIETCTGGYSYADGLDIITIARSCTYSSFGDGRGAGSHPATNPGDIDVIGRRSGGGSTDDGTAIGDLARRAVRCAADQYGLTSVLAGTGIIR